MEQWQSFFVAQASASAALTGLLNLDFDTYESLHDDKRYQSCLRQHAARIFHGKPSAEMQDPEWCGVEGWPEDDEGGKLTTPIKARQRL